MRCGSLFAGIGGLELGLERAGMEVVWQVERDPYCRRVLAKHWPDVTRYEDVKDVGAHNLEAVDLICGGFPCQPVSVAGKRKAQDDERWLWPEFARIIRELRPRYVLVENVPGLLVRGFGDVLGDLAALGYDAEWGCVSAASVGAPHLRRRVFVIAHATCGGAPTGKQQGQLHQSVADGEAGVVAHTEGSILEKVGSAEQAPGVRRRPANPSEEVADTDSRGLDRIGSEKPSRIEGTRRDVADGCGPDGGLHNASKPDTDWEVEPDVGRVADGVPSRVDRLRALGNAVVPQVAEYIGHRIMNAEVAR